MNFIAGEERGEKTWLRSEVKELHWKLALKHCDLWVKFVLKLEWSTGGLGATCNVSIQVSDLMFLKNYHLRLSNTDSS